MQRPKRVLSGVEPALGMFVRFWTSRPLLLAAVAALLAAGFVFSGVRALSWMESPQFCGQCHTMTPEVTAHLNSPHANVECAECHVGSGLTGLIKSKWDGMQQMIKLITGTYARPIPPAAHNMPPASQTCLKCHDPSKQAGDLLITRSHFQSDEGNTEQRTALVVRLSPDKQQQTAGIHWHVLSNVEYASSDPQSRTIDWIGVDKPDGTHEEFIAEKQVQMSAQAGQRATELRQNEPVRQMSCYDCHNRVGHEFTNPTQAVDDAIASDQIDRNLPFIERWGVAVLNATYKTDDDAFAAINALRASYQKDYPWVFLDRPAKLNQSLATLAKIYRETTSPEMKAAASDYPSYLGHTDSAGCFRCHDGGHYKIVNGAISTQPIPSSCDTCHTFPTVGDNTPNVMIGPPPASHTDKLWVFNHKNQAGSLDVAQTSCDKCHSQTYCTNCHASGATKVQHDNMFFNHAAVIKQTGPQPCAYCHQKPFCERCHAADDKALTEIAR